MTIQSVEAIPFTLPVARPLLTGTGQIDSAHHVLIRITTRDGVTGHAESSPRWTTTGETQETVVAAVRRIAPSLVGMDPLRHGLIEHRLRQVVGNHAAVSAIELAIQDLSGHLIGRPCWQLWGGVADRVPIAAMLSGTDPTEVAELAVRSATEFGTTAFKIKIGVDVDTDLACCAAVRNEVGEHCLLYADANGSLPPERVSAVLGALADLGFGWCEEPVRPLENQSRPAPERLPLPVCGDESCRTPQDAARALATSAIDRLVVKAARTGYAPSTRMLDRCVAVGVAGSVASQFESAIGVYASAALAASHELVATAPAEVLSFLDMADDLVVAPPTIANGCLLLSENAGLGMAIDEDKLTHYRADAP